MIQRPPFHDPTSCRALQRDTPLPLILSRCCCCPHTPARSPLLVRLGAQMKEKEKKGPPRWPTAPSYVCPGSMPLPTNRNPGSWAPSPTAHRCRPPCLVLFVLLALSFFAFVPRLSAYSLNGWAPSP